MKIVVPALAAAFIATIGAGSAAQAAVINFGVSVLDGAALGYSGTRLNASTAFNFDGAALLVSSVGAADDSGLVPFPGPFDTVSLSPTDIMYGSGTGPGMLTADVVKSWTGKTGDAFTETLTDILSINRSTVNAITVVLTGTVSDADGIFVDTPVDFILSANQVGGPGTAIVAGFTNTTTIPEPSTWVMLALGFAGLGYAAVRRSAKERSAIAI
jgi:PEP-CTERM motif